MVCLCVQDSDVVKDAGCEGLWHEIQTAANRLQKGSMHHCRAGADTMVLFCVQDSDEAKDAGCERLRHEIEVAANRLTQGGLHQHDPRHLQLDPRSSRQRNCLLADLELLFCWTDKRCALF